MNQAPDPDFGCLPSGILDLHIHAAPDRMPRCIDDMTLAQTAGIAGGVFKRHGVPTAGRAGRVSVCAPRFHAMGSIVLNRVAGGLDAEKLERWAVLADTRAQFVWLPTHDAANDRRRKERHGPVVRVVDRGKVLPEVLEVAQIAAQHQLVLATGHLDPEESCAVLKAAAPYGGHLVATHVTAEVTHFTHSQIARALDAGAIAEICARNLLVRRADKAIADPDAITLAVKLIHHFGPENFILSSDLGAMSFPTPVAGLAAIARAFLRAGVSDAALLALLVDTPRRLVTRT